MGFFSWLTADTEESIANAWTDRCKPVYLLQPDNAPPIYEPEYDGYGVFGGKDVHEWLIEANADALDLDLTGKSPDQLRMMGIALDVGSVFKDLRTGLLWSIFHPCELMQTQHFAGRFDEYCEGLQGKPNELLDEGVLQCKNVQDLLELPFPLKFSFNKDARYEALPPSSHCPSQGYFY